MPFYILEEHEIADSGDMNANFYHIAQGTKYPMSGVSLTVSDLSADLGSATFKWDNLYGNYLYTDSITNSQGLWKLLFDIDPTTTTGTIILENINSDDYDEIKIEAWLSSGDTSVSNGLYVYLQGNNTVGSSWQFMRNLNSIPALSAARYLGSATAYNYIQLGNAVTNGSSYGVLNIRYKHGDMKISNYTWCQQRVAGSYIYDHYINGMVHSSQTSITLTGFYFGGGSNYSPNRCKIRVWGKK